MLLLSLSRLKISNSEASIFRLLRHHTAQTPLFSNNQVLDLLKCLFHNLIQPIKHALRLLHQLLPSSSRLVISPCLHRI